MSAKRKFNRQVNRMISRRIERKRRAKALEFIQRDIARRNMRIGQGPTGTRVAQDAGVMDIAPQQTAATQSVEPEATAVIAQPHCGHPITAIRSSDEGHSTAVIV